MMRYEILDADGTVENTILADESFVAQVFPGRYRPAPDLPVSIAPAAAEIDTERDRRIDAGFEFEGVSYQSRPTDRENIAGAVLIAAVDPTYTVGWIASDNTVVQMDAAMLLRFGRAVADRKQALIFAGRQLKDMQPIPADYADDRWWP